MPSFSNKISSMIRLVRQEWTGLEVIDEVFVNFVSSALWVACCSWIADRWSCQRIGLKRISEVKFFSFKQIWWSLGSSFFDVNVRDKLLYFITWIFLWTGCDFQRPCAENDFFVFCFLTVHIQSTRRVNQKEISVIRGYYKSYWECVQRSVEERKNTDSKANI